MDAVPHKHARTKTLNDRLRLLGLVFVLIVGSVCTAIFAYFELSHQESAIHRELDRTIVLQQQFIDKWLDDRMSDISTIAAYSAVKEWDADAAQQLLAAVKQNHAEFRSISMIGSDGKISDGMTIVDRSYFQSAKSGKASISDVLSSRVDGKRIIVFAAPVLDKNNAFEGLIMGTVELTVIENLLNQFSYGKDGQTYLVDRDGTLITGDGSDGAKSVAIDGKLLARAKAGIDSAGSYDNYLGVKVFGAHQWAKNGNWLIIGEAARNDVLASLYRELIYAVLFILLAVLAAVMVMLRTAKRISAPIEQLLQGVRLIKGGDYRHRIDTGAFATATVEFQQLGLSFNNMSDTILERSEALRQERNFASSIIDTAASLIVVLDKEGAILRFNGACERATGYSFEEAKQSSLYDLLIPPDEREAVAGHFRNLIAAKGSWSNENHWRSRTGELRLIAWTNTVLHEPNGEIQHIIGIGIDITEQREVERALRESEERFRLIVGSMDEVVATFDTDLQLTGVYGRSADVTDREALPDRAGRAGHASGQLFASLRSGPHDDALRSALEEKNSVFDWSDRELATGSERYYQTSYSSLRDGEGEIKGVLSVSRELTQLKAAEAAFLTSQARLNNILESITDAFMALDCDWKFTYVNSEAERMLGKQRTSIMGRTLWDAFPLIVDTDVFDHYRKAMAEQIPVSTESYIPFKHEWYEIHIYPSVEGLSIYFQDITARKQLEQTASESQSRLSTIFETVPAGIVVAGADGVIAMANRMTEELFGMTKEDIVNRSLNDSIWHLRDFEGNTLSPDDFPLAVALQTGKPVLNMEFVFVRADGGRKMLSCNCTPLFDSSGKVSSAIASLSDITSRIATQRELQDANEELRKLSSLDGLTGVFNRRYFNEQLKGIWGRHALKKEPLSLIMLDIDFFKAYNDTYGHLGGDMSLKSVAYAIKESLSGPGRFVARYGGEEFGIVLPGTKLQEAAKLAEKLRARIESKQIPHASSKVSPYLSISLGVASCVPTIGSEEESLISRADMALYEAKRTRNCVVLQAAEEKRGRGKETAGADVLEK